MKVILHVLGFVQWLAAMVIALVSIAAVLYIMGVIEQAGIVDGLVASVGIDAIGGPAIAEMLDVIIQIVVMAFGSMSVVTPGMLLSILLMLSALYCQRAAGSMGRKRNDAEAHPTVVYTVPPGQPQVAGNE